MARIRTLFVVALSAVTLLVVGLPSAQARVVFDKVFVKPSVAAMYPSGLEWDQANTRIVVADTGRNRILFYSLKGHREGAFGHHGTGPGEFDTPRDVAIDGRGRIYVADAANNRVQAFTKNGDFRWSTPGTGDCDKCLNTPIGLTWDSAHKVLLVASTGHNPTPNPPADKGLIKAFSAGGNHVWTSPKPEDLGIDAPRDVARGPDDRIWIADYKHHQIKAYDVSANGAVWNSTPEITLGSGAIGSAPNLNFPYNVDFSRPNASGEFEAYVSSTGNSQVVVWNIDGTNATYLDQMTSKCLEPCPNPGPVPSNQIEDLRRVVVTNGGQVVTADFWGNGLKVFRSNRNVLRDIEGKRPRARGVAEAFGVDVGPNGVVYAVDRLNQQVEWYAPGGAFRGTAGSRGDTAPDEFSWPEAIAAASNGVWTANSRLGRLQFWTPDLDDNTPEVVNLGVAGDIHDVDVATNGDVYAVVGGPENAVYRVADGSHTVQQFASGFADPQGVAVGGSFVFVADAGTKKVVKLNSSGGVADQSSLRLHSPEGVGVAPNGHVWVADTNANTIVHLQANLSLVERYKPRGNKALDLPHTLAVSPDGDWLFVADTFNNRVLRFRI